MKNPQKYDAIVITAQHPLFRSIIWAAQARSTDETRIALQHLHFVREGKVCKIVATDGRRMHVGTYDPGLLDDDIAQIETGNYQVVAKSPKVIVLTRDDEEEVVYPRWRGILPPEFGFRERRLVLSRDNVALIGIRFDRLLATDFVHQACGFGAGFGKDEPVHAIVRDHGEDCLVSIQHELGTAYVAPMRLTGDDAVPESEAEATPEFIQRAANNGGVTGIVIGEQMGGEIDFESKPPTPSPQTQEEREEPIDGPEIVDVDVESESVVNRRRYVTASEVLALSLHLTGKASAAEKEEALVTFANDYGLHGLEILQSGVSSKIGKPLQKMLQDLIAAHTSPPETDY